MQEGMNSLPDNASSLVTTGYDPFQASTIRDKSSERDKKKSSNDVADSCESTAQSQEYFV